ncbi:hypothetical protein AAFF_G00210330 [Aldrovandia affinis]|uniref:Uncharacterized protein n=1 Tax=Aldrovandia affinis TaxID=143900 RepID=A0AAD7WUR4_9TELE|nr:hypothetical protein AAFF_G00210330 [Aldrovandia affinis]
MAFIQGDKHRVKELKCKTKLARLHHKNKVEEKLTTGNAREAWQGLNTMMGRAQNPAQIKCSDPASIAEQFNFFYARFNRTDRQDDWVPTYSSLPSQRIIVERWNVTSILLPLRMPLGQTGL